MKHREKEMKDPACRSRVEAERDDVDAAIARLKARRERSTLGESGWKAARDEGRR